MQRKKPSDNAMLHYVLGCALLVPSFIAYMVTKDGLVILFGMFGLVLLWIMGLQRDVYG